MTKGQYKALGPDRIEKLASTIAVLLRNIIHLILVNVVGVM